MLAWERREDLGMMDNGDEKRSALRMRPDKYPEGEESRRGILRGQSHGSLLP